MKTQETAATGEVNSPRYFDDSTIEGKLRNAEDSLAIARKAYENSGLGQREQCWSQVVAAESKRDELLFQFTKGMSN